VGRQVRLLREASKLVAQEMSTAESTLHRHLTRFGETAASLAEHRALYTQAAHAAEKVSEGLNDKLSDMLDGLTQTTRLTDAARQSAEQAILAANETAQAVSETTRSAVAGGRLHGGVLFAHQLRGASCFGRRQAGKAHPAAADHAG
jgi:methyl-accepting chemotaxis protein